MRVCTVIPGEGVCGGAGIPDMSLLPENRNGDLFQKESVGLMLPVSFQLEVIKVIDGFDAEYIQLG